MIDSIIKSLLAALDLDKDELRAMALDVVAHVESVDERLKRIETHLEIEREDNETDARAISLHTDE